MSEYQYYEFRAVDRPLTPEQMTEIRALSSRADITPLCFSNTYNYSDFRGEPRRLMESHYDAHVYVSNFGTVTFMLRVPRTVLPDETLAQYAAEEVLGWWTTDEHTIVEWQRNEDPFDAWVEGKGWMDQLLPLRDELMRGDYRSLYIGWLSSLWDDSLEDEEEEEDGEDMEDEDHDDDDDDDDGARRREPPVPAGLGSLTAAQSALAEFLGVDSDLLAVAAQSSPKALPNATSPANATKWVARLPEQEVRSLVERVLGGEGLRVQTEIQSRYHRSEAEPTENSSEKSGAGRRSAADLLTMAAQAEQERKRQELEKKERKRHAHLKGLVPRLSELWTTVHALAEEQKSASYDKASTLLMEMRDAYDYAGRRPEFDAEFARFLGQFSRRTSLVRMLKTVGLIS